MLILSLRSSFQNLRDKNASGFGHSTPERTVYPTTQQVSLANCRLVEPVLGKHCSTTGNVKRWLEALTPHAFQHLPLNHTYHFLLNLPTHLNSWFGQFESTPSVPVKLNPFQANSSTTKTFWLVCSDQPVRLLLYEQLVTHIQVYASVSQIPCNCYLIMLCLINSKINERTHNQRVINQCAFNLKYMYSTLSFPLEILHAPAQELQLY